MSTTRWGRCRNRFVLVCLAGLLGVPETAAAASLPAGADLDDLTELSLEQLMDIEVTSVSKKTEKLSEAPAAVFVLTAEDIRRSGVTSIPEALRLVPGIHVARVDANKWAISARGFNGRFANKLLVLIDGRTVYTVMYSGVFWDVQDVLLEDVDRIEVVRGPGATLWGANAVNGVINIITRNAGETQGTFTSVAAGTEEQGLGAVRYGGRLGDRVHYRFYAKYFDRDRSVFSTGEEAADSWNAARGGFRMDWTGEEGRSFMLQGDLYDGTAMQTQTVPSLASPYMSTFVDDIGLSGGHILGLWSRTFSDASGMALQVYYDRAKRRDPILVMVGSTLDLDLQHQVSLGRRHGIVWGLGYRQVRYDFGNTFTVTFPDDLKSMWFTSAFVQDDIVLVPDRLRLTLGSKFEYQEHSGPEIQPNVRFLWTPGSRHTIWGAVSRAARTPSLAELGAHFVMEAAPPGKYHPDRVTLIAVQGSTDFESEYLVAHELGYRVQAASRVSLDIAAFYNEYDNLRSTPYPDPFLEVSPSPPHLLLQFGAVNNSYAETRGVELAADWQVLDGWRLRTSYTRCELAFHPGTGTEATFTELMHGDAPDHMVFVRSSMNLPGDLEWDLGLRWVDELKKYGIDGYATADARLGWNATPHLGIAVVGQNLLDARHPEFMPEIYDSAPTEVERSVYFTATWRP